MGGSEKERRGGEEGEEGEDGCPPFKYLNTPLLTRKHVHCTPVVHICSLQGKSHPVPGGIVHRSLSGISPSYGTYLAVTTAVLSTMLASDEYVPQRAEHVKQTYSTFSDRTFAAAGPRL